MLRKITPTKTKYNDLFPSAFSLVFIHDLVALIKKQVALNNVLAASNSNSLQFQGVQTLMHQKVL
jgi:hypothetical protein